MIVVVVIWGFSFFLQALLAESYEFELVPEDPVLGQPAKGILDVFKGIVRGSIGASSIFPHSKQVMW